VESNTQPPILSVSGPAAIDEGGSATFSASGSLDPNGTIVSYSWSFGDGATGDGAAPSHIYLQDGVYDVTLTATDNDGLVTTATVPIVVHNVAPAFAGFPDATRATGEPYSLASSFIDPGSDSWIVTVTWGDGSTSQQSLGAREFALNHAYAAAGAYTVSVTVADEDTSTSTIHTVTVVQPAPGLDAALPLVDQLVAARKIAPAVGTLFKAQIIAAQRLIARGNQPAARAVLQALVVQIDLLVRLRQVSAVDIAPLRSLLVQVIGSLRPS
jgi:hypothetical protein